MVGSRLSARLEIEEVKRRRIDRELQGGADLRRRHGFDPSGEESVFLHEQACLVFWGCMRLDRHARGRHVKEDEGIRAELLEHIDRDLDAR